MDAGELIARQSGWLDVKDDRDTPLTFYFQTIPQTDWAACSSFPTQLMLDAFVADVTTGFRRITAGDFSYRIKPGGGPRTQTLIRECNRLAADLDRIQREHELSRRALQESEARYRTLVEGLPAITYIAALDAASTTLYVSPQVESIIGLTPEQYREDPDIWRKHLHPDDHDRVMKEVAASHESGRPLDVEYRMTTADGRTVWVHDKAQIVRDPVGRPLVLQGAMFDITRRKEDEEALRKNEGLLSTVLGAIQDSVSLWDLDFNLLYGNKAMADIVRQTGGNPEAGNLRDMIPTSERLDVWVRRFNTVLQTGKPMRSVRTAEEEPLAPRPYETYVAPVRDSQGRVFAIVSVYRDLSNHMREAEERRELANRLLEVQDAERRSVSDLLHDQMGQLLTLAKLDLDGFRTLNGTQRDRVKAISRRLDMALTAVRNMAAHLHPPHMDTMPLAEALELLVADFGRQSSIRTSFTRQGCVPNLAPAKKTCLYRILQESLTNVARHARASQVRILLRAESDEVTLEVRDNGKGLSDSSDTQRRGIGLISMRERVRQCGGRFEITSGKAGGCVVRAAIPVGEKAPGGWEEP
jgi:PAS domain S-box-containing protein